MEIKRSEAVEILKAYLPNYLESKGLNLRTGNVCPCCAGGQHKKNAFHYDRRANRVTCFSCGLRGDIFELVRAEYDMGDFKQNFNAIVEKTADLLGFTLVNEKGEKLTNGDASTRELPKPVYVPSDEPEEEIDYSEYIKKTVAQNDFKYLESRGISKEIQKEFMIGLDLKWRNPKVVADWKALKKDVSRIPPSPRCIIPNSKYSYLARDVRNNLTDTQKQYSKQAVGRKRFFNHQALTTAKTVFIVEGEIDALSVIEAGFVGVGLCSAHNVAKLIEELKNSNNEQKFVVMLDGDETGKKRAAVLCEGLQELGLTYIDSAAFFPADLDPNQKLVNDRERFIYELKVLEETVNNKDKNIESDSTLYANISKSMVSYLELLRQNKTVEEIAEIRNVKVNTVESMIFKLYDLGKIDDISFLIDTKYQQNILDIINSPDWNGKLSYIKERVSNECSYTCIRAVVLNQKKRNNPQCASLDYKIDSVKNDNAKTKPGELKGFKGNSQYNMSR